MYGKTCGTRGTDHIGCYISGLIRDEMEDIAMPNKYLFENKCMEKRVVRVVPVVRIIFDVIY